MADATDALGESKEENPPDGCYPKAPRALEKNSEALSLMVAGARNHLPANRSVEFRFEILI